MIGKKRYIVCFKVGDPKREIELRKKFCEFESPRTMLIEDQVIAIMSDLDARGIYEKLCDALC